MQRDFAYDIAEYLVKLDYDSIPVTAIEATKKDIYDSLSTALAGSSAPGVKELLELLTEWGGTPQAAAFVFGKKLPAQNAAMVNAAMIHGYDFDDTHDVAMMHCGCIEVSTALAVAEMLGNVTGKELLTAITAGLDIHCRLGIATTVIISESGWVYTPVMGVFAGVVTAAKLMKLNEDQIVNALGIAYAQAAGNYQAITDSAWTKKYQPGFAARAAVTACELAAKGASGSHNTFEGIFGLYHVYLHDRYDADVLRDRLGEYFTNEDLAFKPWPCGRPSQPPINIAIEAHDIFGLNAEKIDHVDVYMNEHLTIGGFTPAEARRHPKSIIDAQFSIPYGVACGLANGRYGLSDYSDEALARPEILAISEKVNGLVDPEIEAQYHAKICPIKIDVFTKDGSVYHHELKDTLGGKEKPMTDKDFEAKMADCVACAALKMPEDTGAKIKAMVYSLENSENAAELMQALIAH